MFCFTPKGRLIALPRGATPIDFAYAVHTGIGNTCVGCKVNGKIMPLVTELCIMATKSRLSAHRADTAAGLGSDRRHRQGPRGHPARNPRIESASNMALLESTS